MTRAVLFDLDGTLVDSAPAIIGAFQWTLRTHGRDPVVPLDRSLIGPPLRETLRRITGCDSAAELDAIAATFRGRYDAIAAAETPAYPGVGAVLESLGVRGSALMVVTNKRIRPTRLILDGLGIAGAFRAVYALDAVEPPAADKPALVGVALREHGFAAEACVLVGDAPSDADAAAAHGIRFVAARYGYGDIADGAYPVAASIDSIAELPAVLDRLGA